MNKEKVMDIKKENKKAFGKFILLLIASMVVGAFIGMMSVKIGKGAGDTIADGVFNFITLIAPYASLVITFVAAIMVGVLFVKSKKRYAAWNEEDEEEIERIELWLSYAMYVVSASMILVFFFFAAGITALNINDLKEEFHVIPVVCWLSSIFINMVFTMVAQRKLIDFIRIINPEKKGSIYDTNFSKKWEESCDEAERLGTYKASFKALKTTTMTCLGLWLFCVIGSIIWNFGILPVAMVTIIWFVLTTSYTRACIKEPK